MDLPPGVAVGSSVPIIPTPAERGQFANRDDLETRVRRG
jgi:hypothetical protein